MNAYAVTASGFKTHWLDAIRQAEKACKASMRSWSVAGNARPRDPSVPCGEGLGGLISMRSTSLLEFRRASGGRQYLQAARRP